jgi:carbon storage regulator
MLVLTRKKDESIMIGHGIEVVILGFDGDKVRVGIEAPKEITILRKEVYLDVADINKQAITSTIPSNLPLGNIFLKKD